MHLKKGINMIKQLIVFTSALACFTSVSAAPGDGPTIDVNELTIRGDINGEITNGRQGGGGSAGIFAGSFGVGVSGGANATVGGRVNVNGIFQQGQSMLKAGTVLLDTRLQRNIVNNAGDVTVSGITQIGK
jgi:hypothetical protein